MFSNVNIITFYYVISNVIFSQSTPGSTFNERGIDVSNESFDDAWNELIKTEQQYLQQLEFVHRFAISWLIHCFKAFLATSTPCTSFICILRSYHSMLQSIGAGNILNNWPQLVEQAQLMVMMLDSNPVPKTFAESITSEFVSVYSDYCGTQRQMTETLQKKRNFDPEFKENLKTLSWSSLVRGPGFLFGPDFSIFLSSLFFQILKGKSWINRIFAIFKRAQTW